VYEHHCFIYSYMTCHMYTLKFSVNEASCHITGNSYALHGTLESEFLQISLELLWQHINRRKSNKYEIKYNMHSVCKILTRSLAKHEISPNDRQSIVAKVLERITLTAMKWNSKKLGIRISHKNNSMPCLSVCSIHSTTEWCMTTF